MHISSILQIYCIETGVDFPVLYVPEGAKRKGENKFSLSRFVSALQSQT